MMNHPVTHQRLKRAGFTLVELMAVIAVMLLVLKLALPSLKGLMGGAPELVARKQLIGDLNQARTMALRNGTPVYVVFMPLFTEMQPVTNVQEAKHYLSTEANGLLGGQSVSYALYAEYLPGDQPGTPSRRWLTDWKRLPDGFYLAKDDMEIIHLSAEASGSSRLVFSNLQNDHSRGVGNARRGLKLPYIMYNSRGELAARGNPGELRVGGFYLSVTEGGVFQPGLDANGKFKLEDAEREPPEVMVNKKRMWLEVNGVTGKADVVEEDPGLPRPYMMRVHTLRVDPATMDGHIREWMVKNSAGRIIHNTDWASNGMWGNRDSRGKFIFIGNRDRVRPMAVARIPRNKLMSLIAYLRRHDPGVELNYQRMDP